MGLSNFTATEPSEALKLIEQEDIQVWLIDQHLNHDQRGLDFIEQYRPAHFQSH